MADSKPQTSFACSRRQFLPTLLQEALVTLGLLRGGQGARLSDLGDLPDDRLAVLRPVVNPGCEIMVEEDQVWARHTKAGIVVRLFAVKEADKLAAFNHFDGEHTLGEAGACLAEEMGCSEAEGFALARDLFLALVRQLVCLPKDPPQAYEPALDADQG
jgi:hypothetical protein